MKIYKTTKGLKNELDYHRIKGKSIGLVPTMGALHEGHLSLINKALSQNNLVVVSIFVNPTQFNNINDLLKYPRTLESDVRLLESVNNDIYVFAPEAADIYNKNIKAKEFDFDGLENEMEGEFRQGHFNGVGTIVKQLLEIVEPSNAYFGEKDFQQLQIIKKLVEKHKIDTKIIGCKIHRDNNGLAMSSRNARLEPKHKLAAPFIYKTLKTAKIKFGTKSANQVTEWVKKQFSKNELLTLEYFKIADVNTLKQIKRKNKNKKYRAFIAVYAGDVRLIDNIALN